jgi:hypothetical protein
MMRIIQGILLAALVRFQYNFKTSAMDAIRVNAATHGK